MAGAVFVVVTFEPRLPKEVRMATTRVKTKRAHSNAAKASPAAAVLQPWNMATQLLFRPAARAMKPANQKIMVTASRATVAKICWM